MVRVPHPALLLAFATVVASAALLLRVADGAWPAVLSGAGVVAALVVLGTAMRAEAPAAPRPTPSEPPTDLAALGLGAPLRTRLAKAGLRTTRDLLDDDLLARLAPEDRERVAPLRRVARLVAIRNVGACEAELLLAAGVRAPHDLVAADPRDLADRLNAVNEATHFCQGIVAPGEVRQWIEDARALARPTE